MRDGKKRAANAKSKNPSRQASREDDLHKIPLRITDTTLRDAHQSIWATRMRTEDILPIIDVIDQVGYYSLEMWGGATFDVCLRFLRENPWERLRVIKSQAKNTPLQMLLRGQNLVGYRNYADDVVDRFVALACENGIDIFRVFDALNDTRNLEAAIKAVKKHGGHAQGTLAYTLSPVHTAEKFVQYAREQVAIGIDSLCIKDMAGILTPIAAERLVRSLVEQVNVPIQLHCHATSGMATATYVEGVRAGAGAIDCAISSMAGSSAQPPVETLAAIFRETNYSANLDMDALAKVAKYFDALAPKRQPKGGIIGTIDPGILVHQIPGGMISNFRSQLEMQGALDKLPDALDEVSKVREDLGWPPLVTPTSQIVGTQAVMNVLAGERYKIIPNEVKEYVRGMYGRSPASINPKLISMILGDDKPITYRPADKIKPMLPHATDGLDAGLIENEEDIIAYCILPEPAKEYFSWRKLPPDQRPPIPAEVEQQKMEAVSPEKKETEQDVPGNENSREPMMHLEDYRGFGHLLRQAAGMKIDHITISKGDFTLKIRSSGIEEHGGDSNNDADIDVAEEVSAPKTTAAEQPRVQKLKSIDTPAVEKAPKPGAAYPHTLKAPLVGTFYSSAGSGKPSFVKVGDSVKKGTKVCIVEAMKLFNEIVAAEDGKILALLAKDGEHVQKDQPLIAYEPV
jgi:oxaloacetate decarboxylase alpha subunit